MQFRVLGPVEVVGPEGQPIDIGGSQPRALLAMLLVAGDRVVPVDAIIDRLWPQSQPASATSTLQSYVSRLRRALDPHRPAGSESKLLAWESSGYRLRVEDDSVDFVQFERGADLGRALLADGDATRARDALDRALGLWRGAALGELADQPWARGIATRLDERRLAALEDRIRADLLLCRHDVVVAELADLIDEHPLREGLWEQYALALYRSGRQAEALRALEELRRRLLDGLGIDPSRRIRELEAQILAHDPALSAPPSTPVAPAPAVASAAPVEDSQPATGDQRSDDSGRADLARISVHHRGLSPDEIVGRLAERARVERALERARQTTQWVLIEGEAGIGKTRLLEHLADEADRAGFLVLWARSHESGAAPAFWPWLPAIRACLAAGHSLPEDARRLIVHLLDPHDGEGSALSTDGGRFPLFAAIALLFEAAARCQPVMIALDDLQWADPASLELIEFMTGHVVAVPIIFAATLRELEIGRNDALVQALAHISRRPLADRIHLRGLAPSDSDCLVRRTIGGDAPTDVVDAIFRRSDGNPFFMTELARLLAGDAGLSEAELLRRVGVPAGVRDVVHRRLARLPAPTMELIQTAAALGRHMHVGLLSRAANVSIDDCLDQLEPAIVDRLLVDVPDSPGVVQFNHALVREVVLDDMSVLRRARLHVRAADAIEALAPSDDSAEIVADHLWHAATLGVGVRAAVALERAAMVAIRRFAFESADSLLERALELRKAFPADEVDLGAELRSINLLAGVRRARFGYKQASLNTPIERAKDIARSTDEDSVLAELLWTEWAGSATACALDHARQLSLELLDLAARSDDPVIQAAAHSSWGIQSWHEGDLGEAVNSLDIAVELLGDWQSRALTGSAPPNGLAETEVLARGFHAIVHELAGQPLGSRSPLLSMAAAPLAPYQLLTVWVSEAIRAMLGGHDERAILAASRAVELALGEQFEFFRSAGVCVLGSSTIAVGRPAEGLEVLDRGIAQYRGLGVLTVLSYYLAMRAEGHLALGDIDAARLALDDAMVVLDQSGERWPEPFVLCTAAAVDHAAGAPRESITAQMSHARNLALAQGAGGVATRIAARAAQLGLGID